VPLSVIVLLFVIRRAMAPVSDLKKAIAEKDSGNLSPLRTEGLPSELEPIAHTLNVVLARLAAALSAEREFAANSAHELRTPIAGALAQTQLLIDELGTSPAAERARLVEQSLGKLGALTEKLLQLARADAGLGLSDTPHDLVPVIDTVVEDMRRHIGPARAINFLVEDGALLVRPVDPDALAIALRNLIENAVLHGDAGSPVSIRVDGRGCLTVSNKARLFSPEELARIRQRFHRIDDNSPGSGLGLAIVERLLLQMNASLDLHSRPSDGEAIFEVVIRFA
jgi:two-component system OmpR family sensor kinase